MWMDRVYPFKGGRLVLSARYLFTTSDHNERTQKQKSPLAEIPEGDQFVGKVGGDDADTGGSLPIIRTCLTRDFPIRSLEP